MWLWGRENCLVPSFLRTTCSGGLLQTGRGYLQTSQRDNRSPPRPLCVPRALGMKVRLESCAADMCLMAVIPLPGWPFVHFRAQPLHPSSTKPSPRPPRRTDHLPAGGSRRPPQAGSWWAGERGGLVNMIHPLDYLIKEVWCACRGPLSVQAQPWHQGFGDYLPTSRTYGCHHWPGHTVSCVPSLFSWALVSVYTL